MNSQRQLIIAVVVSIVFLGGVGVALYQIKKKESSLEVYRNVKYGFQVKYPNEWKQEAPNEENIIVELISPKEEMSFHIGAYEAKEAITIEHLKELNREVAGEISGAKNSTDVSLAGLPAFRVIIKDSDGSVNTSITTLNGQMVYVLQYRYYPGTPKRIIKVADRIIDSFTLLQAGNN